MRVSFATTCMGRAHHLKETLPKNIRDNAGADVEFVVLNYASRDDMHQWMTTDPVIREAAAAGIIRYAVMDAIPRPGFFHHAHAKNVAHRLATGDIVCNLDADNFTGPGFAEYLDEVFTQNPEILVHPSYAISRKADVTARGFFGRIALTRRNFNRMGGYNEEFKGWGKEDSELMTRASSIGLGRVTFRNLDFCRVIGHSHEERVENVDSQYRMSSLRHIESSYNNASRYLRYKERASLLLTPAQSNNGTDFGLGRVMLEADGAVTDVEIEPFSSNERLANHYVRRLTDYFQLRAQARREVLEDLAALPDATPG